MRKEIFLCLTTLLLLSGCHDSSHGSTSASADKLIPIDTNIDYGLEPNVLYYVDPDSEEGGENRAIRINYAAMDFTQLSANGQNAHSIDRAGKTDKFYIRTQNSPSFDVMNFKEGTVKTVSLGDHKPRAVGAYNDKYKIQLLSAKDMPVVDVIDVTNDNVVATIGDRHFYDKGKLTSNAGSGSATGHAMWFDVNHFGLIDRVHNTINVIEVSHDSNNTFQYRITSALPLNSAVHALERYVAPGSKDIGNVFYAMGEGDLTKGIPPYVAEIVFDPKTGTIALGRIVEFAQSNAAVNGIKPTTHHAGVSPDGKYIYVPVLDGKIYIVDRGTMKIVKTIYDPEKKHLGAAHIVFSEPLHLAIITNHFSEYVTIIDTNTQSVVKELKISPTQTFDPQLKHLLQPHFSYMGKNGFYFYTFSTQDGNFLKINLKTLEIEDVLHTGGAPEQAHS